MVVWRCMALAMVLTSAAASVVAAQSSDGSFMSPQHFMQRDGEGDLSIGSANRVANGDLNGGAPSGLSAGNHHFAMTTTKVGDIY